MGPKKKGGGAKKGGGKVTTDEDDLKSWNLQQRQVIVDLMNRLDDLKTINHDLRSNRKNLLTEQVQEQGAQGDQSKWYDKTNEKKTLKISKFKTLIEEVSKKTAESGQQQTVQLKEIQDDHNRTTSVRDQEIVGLQQQLGSLKQTEKDKVELFTEIEKLKTAVEEERKSGMIEVNNRERDKIEAVKKIQQEMDFKVKETQANLMALNDEQLQTTTRLTILQNHQLTTELEYQSNQTESLIKRNDKQKTQIDGLRRDIELHQQIEKQLAKRAHVSQKVIKKLREEHDKHDQELKDLLYKQSQAEQKDEKSGLIEFLESKLQQIEEKLNDSQNEYERMQSDCLEVQEKLNQGREKYKRAALLMAEMLEDTLAKRENILVKPDDDFQSKRAAASARGETAQLGQQQPISAIEHASREEKVELMFQLLKQMQPYLSANNLTVIPLPQNNVPVYQAHENPHADPALNNLLTNIKVQVQNPK